MHARHEAQGAQLQEERVPGARQAGQQPSHHLHRVSVRGEMFLLIYVVWNDIC
jgi:hypothetical protein